MFGLDDSPCRGTNAGGSPETKAGQGGIKTADLAAAAPESSNQQNVDPVPPAGTEVRATPRKVVAYPGRCILFCPCFCSAPLKSAESPPLWSLPGHFGTLAWFALRAVDRKHDSLWRLEAIRAVVLGRSHSASWCGRKSSIRRQPARLGAAPPARPRCRPRCRALSSSPPSAAPWGAAPGQ